MFTKDARHRAVIAGALTLAAVSALTGCAPSAPHKVHGERLDVGYSSVQYFGADGTLLGRASYSTSSAKNLALLTNALGAPATIHKDKLPGRIVTIRYEWGGLELEADTAHGKSFNGISVEKSRVNGLAIFALDKYRVGGPFPADGAEDICSSSPMPAGIAALLGALGPQRYNAFKSPETKDVLGIIEAERDRGVIDGFQAPNLAFGC